MRVHSIRDVAAAARGRRKDLRLSQADLAHSIGISRKWVSEFEAGKPTAELGLVIRLLDALALSCDLGNVEGAVAKAQPGTTRPVDLDALLDGYRTHR